MDAISGEPPLAGMRIVEFAGIGPGPFAGMMLADMGADIIRIERPGSRQDDGGLDYLARGRRSLTLDLKAPGAVEAALRVIEGADGLIEGFRPGVMERLGLGPEVARARNARLVYGRMTGWGQSGPISHTAGHDLTYIAITGALWATGEANRPPVFPLNLLGDFGGGGMFLAFGMVAAMLRAARTGQGDIVDAAICDGTSTLMAMIHSRRAQGLWQDRRASNALDGGAPWYSVYECSDGQWIAIGALEPQFWAVLLAKLGLTSEEIGDRSDRSQWPAIRQRLSAIFVSRSRDEWTGLLSDCDACFAPVLSPAEAASHPQNRARAVFDKSEMQPMPAPRFSDARTALPPAASVCGADSREILTEVGLTPHQIDALLCTRAVT